MLGYDPIHWVFISSDVPCNDILIFPANLVTQSSNGTIFSSWLQPQHPQSLWHNHPLLLVVWWWNTLEDLESLHGSGATGSLVRDHASDGLVEDASGSAEMEGTSSGGVKSSYLSEVRMVLYCEAGRYTLARSARS